MRGCDSRRGLQDSRREFVYAPAVFVARVYLKFKLRYPHAFDALEQKPPQLAAVAVGKLQRRRLAQFREDGDVYNGALAVLAHVYARHGDEAVAVGLARQKFRRR